MYALQLKQILTVYQIRVLDRKQEVPSDGAMSDLLWSDPDCNNNPNIHIKYFQKLKDGD